MKFMIIAILIIAMSMLDSCRPKEQTPANVILIIGDGTGFNQLQAGSLFLHGKENALRMFEFPVQMAVSTYSSEGQGYDPQKVQADFDYLKQKPTDSAAAATALATGVKTYNSAIGVDVNKKSVVNYFELAEKAGISTGVVTSVPFSHATPAGFVAHDTSRSNYHQIAQEMIDSSAVDVIFGCGHPWYDEDNQKLREPHYSYISAEVWDGVQSGRARSDADGDGDADPWTFIDTRAQFVSLQTGDAPLRVLGIAPVASTLSANRSGDSTQTAPFMPAPNSLSPTLAEMAAAALNILDDNQQGFYLMIEAGAIDWACHANHSARLVEEVIDLDKTLQTVINWVESHSNWEESLVIVTADHETGFLTGPESGEIAVTEGHRADYKPLVNRGIGQLPGMEWHAKGHTNQLVPFFAKGAGSERFLDYATRTDPWRGKYIDNIDIPTVIKAYLER
ncbi:MAG: alkaline phosphatase [Calditrichaeota bacterium]|nr:MAG: alkaline phosphatase [Calditrichota bacterium]